MINRIVFILIIILINCCASEEVRTVEPLKNVSISTEPEVIEKKKENHYEYDVKFSEKEKNDKIIISCTANSRELNEENVLIKEEKINPKLLKVSPKEIYFRDFIKTDGDVITKKVECDYNGLSISTKDIELKSYMNNPIVQKELKKVQKKIIIRVIENLTFLKNKAYELPNDIFGAIQLELLIAFVKLKNQYILSSNNKYCATYNKKAEKLERAGFTYRINDLIDLAELCKENMK